MRAKTCLRSTRHLCHDIPKKGRGSDWYYKNSTASRSRAMSAQPNRAVQMCMWRRAMGCCLICGTPMETPGQKLDQAASVSRDSTVANRRSEYSAEDDMALYGAVESIIRVYMFKFGLLQKMQSCHILDQYTYLPPSQADFLKILKEYSQVGNLLASSPPPAAISESESESVKSPTDKFISDITANGPFGTTVYAKAAETCRTVGANWVIAGCASCNLAMSRWVKHSNVFVHMQDPKARPNVPPTDSKGKANETAKLLQKITLYFTQDSHGTWTAREPNDILETNYLYRIAANLNSWGIDGNFRYRVIAILYASLYIRQQVDGSQHSINFEAWHIHKFRLLYAETYSAGTFFGMSQPEASAVFNLNEGSSASEWTRLIREKLNPFIEIVHEKSADDALQLSRISEFERRVAEHVDSEQTLFMFAARNWKSVNKGLDMLLMTLKYNVLHDPSAQLLRYRASRFEIEMRPVLRKLIREESEAASKHVLAADFSRLHVHD